jgi:hypothetical protein
MAPYRIVVETLVKVNPFSSFTYILIPREWAKSVNADERKNIREKIKAAYLKKAPTYEALLEICSAIEEEFLFAEAPSRLDYIKSGVQFERRVANKICCLRCCAGSANAAKPTANSTACISGVTVCSGSNVSATTGADGAPVLAMMCQLSQCMSSTSAGGEVDPVGRPPVEMDEEELSRIKRAKRQL